MLTILLITLLIDLVNGQFDDRGCVYNLLYNKGMGRHDLQTTSRLQTPPFALIALNDRFDTVDKCVNYCNDHHWCIATSSYPRTSHLCQFHTDVYSLGFVDKVFKCDNTNFYCAFTNTTILNIDDNVFALVDVDAYGGKTGEFLIPSMILPIEIGEDKFCKVMRTDIGTSHNDMKMLYSAYYGQEATAPKVWTRSVDRLDSGDPYNSGPDNNNFDRAVNPAVNGYPITGILRDIVDPYVVTTTSHKKYTIRDFEKYHFFKNEYSAQTECFISGTDNLIDKEALIGTNAFYITYDDNNYLNCQTTDDDGAVGCFWQDTPTMAWMFADFNIPYTGGLDVDAFGYNKTLIAVKNDGTYEELGWLDRSHCYSDTEGGRDDFRILKGGKKTGQGVHCGIGNWNLIRQADISTPPIDYNTRHSAKVGGGSSLAHNSDKNTGFNNNQETVAVASVINNANNAQICSMYIVLSWGGNQICTREHNHENVGNIKLVPADIAYDAKLYKIYSEGLRMICDVFGSRKCHWVVDGNSIDQIFKFENSYTTNSVDNPITDETKATHAFQVVSIYQKLGKSYGHVGYLSFDQESGHFQTSDDPTRADTRGFIKHGNNTFQRFVKAGIVKSSTPNSIVSGAIDTTDVLDFVEKEGLQAGDDIHFKWVDEETCPEGYYLHQMRCTGSQTCNKKQLGCVKASTPTCTLDANTTSTVPLEQAIYTRCPAGQVVYGINSDEIKCKKLDITHTKPSDHEFPTKSSIGLISDTRDQFTATNKKQASSGNWVGTPIQGIVPNREFVREWRFGQTCHVKYENSLASRAINIPQRTINTPGTVPVTCPEVNQFISFLKCNDPNCLHGFDIYCDVAPSCRLDGEIVNVSPRRNEEGQIIEIPVCPFNMVMVGLACTDTESKTGSTTEPCNIFSIACKELVYDPNYNPTNPPLPSGGDDGGSTKTIIIALGIGIPLLIVAAIVCLCCIPDINPTKATKSQITRNEYDVVRSDYETLRRRRKMIINF